VENSRLKKATYHLWVFTISKIISSAGAQVYAFAISLYILQLTGSATMFAMNLICSILPRIIVAPFAGYFADNFSRKAIVISAQSFSTVAIGGLLIVNLTFGLSLTAIYCTTVILSIASTFSSVTFTSSITGLVDEERYQRAMSLNQMAMSFAAIGSPALGGLLYGTVSMSVFLVIYILASLISIILESTMNFNLFANRKGLVAGQPKESMLQNMKAGFVYIKLQPILIAIILVAFCINFLTGGFSVAYAFIFIERLKMMPTHFGLTEGAYAVGMLLISIYLSIKKVKYPLLFSKRCILILGILMGSIAIPLLLPMNYSFMFGYCIFIMFSIGAIVILVNTPLLVMLQKIISDDYKGRVFSLIETMSTALVPLSIILYALLYDRIPAQIILIISSLLLIGVVLVLLRSSVIWTVHPELKKTRDLTPETISEQ